MGRRWRLGLAMGIATGVLVGLAVARVEAPPDRPTPMRRAPTRPLAPRLVWGPAPSAANPIDGGTPLELDGALPLAAAPEDLEPELGPLARELLERLCPAAARAICAGRAGCGCEQGESECRRDLEAECELWVRCRWSSMEDDGSTVPPAIDPHAVRGCVAGMGRAARECRDVERPEACERLIVEGFRPGEPCPHEGVLCVGGICHAERCQPLPRIGEECPEWMCAEDAICDGERCVPIGGVGRGRPCEDDGECAWELACLDGACAARRGPGRACDGDMQCAIGTRCEDGVCALAERCDLTHGCGDGRMCFGEEGARCEAIGLGDAREGEPCAAGCGPDLQCDGAVCVSLPRLGDACPQGVCAGELRCTMGPGGPVCLAVGLSEGAICVPGWNAPCGPGLGCAFVVDETFAAEEELGTYRCARTVDRGEDCRAAPCRPGDACTYGVVDGECGAMVCDRWAAAAPFSCGEE